LAGDADEIVVKGPLRGIYGAGLAMTAPRAMSIGARLVHRQSRASAGQYPCASGPQRPCHKGCLVAGPIPTGRLSPQQFFFHDHPPAQIPKPSSARIEWLTAEGPIRNADGIPSGSKYSLNFPMKRRSKSAPAHLVDPEPAIHRPNAILDSPIKRIVFCVPGDA